MNKLLIYPSNTQTDGGSILSLISEIIHLTTKPSRTFEMHGVSDIGLMPLSSAGGWICGLV